MPIYEFTCVLPQKQIEGWYDWFAGRGIPVAMVKKSPKLDQYAVWRGTDDRVGSDRWFNTYRIVKSANDFPKPKGAK
jgi:hypothetical protein